VYISGTPRRRAEVGSNRLLPAHRLLMKQVMSYWRVIDTDTCIRTADAATIVNIAGRGRGAGGGALRARRRGGFTRFAFRVSRVFDSMPNSPSLGDRVLGAQQQQQQQQQQPRAVEGAGRGPRRRKTITVLPGVLNCN